MAGRYTVIIETGEKVQQNKMCQYYLRKHCSVILFQMIMVSPGTHLAKKKIESPSAEPLSPSSKNNDS